MMKKLRVAMVQMSAGNDTSRNIRQVQRLLSDVSEVDLIALPETFALRGSSRDYRRSAEPLNGPTAEAIGEVARSRKSWVLAGSIMEKSGSKVFNTSVLFDRSGNITATYRKMHLFEARLDNGMRIREADSYTHGTTPVLTEIEGWKIGLSICYDLRFPELFRVYADKGAHLLLIPSNFTQNTGKDHWEILVRARAIENQCFVVAPDQCGSNPATGVKSYGHSVAVAPWGDVIAMAGTKEQLLRVTLDPALLVVARRRLPAASHRVIHEKSRCSMLVK